MMDAIREKLQKVFQEVFDDDNLVIYDAMTASDVEEWDSLTHMQLIITVETSFGVKFSTNEVLQLKNVGEFISLLKAKLS